jgi:hypothetical protein
VGIVPRKHLQSRENSSCKEVAWPLLLEPSQLHGAPFAHEDTMLAPMLDAKGTKILAKSLFKELRASGYTANQILGLSTELIDLVTQDLRSQGEARPEAEKTAVASL